MLTKWNEANKKRLKDAGKERIGEKHHKKKRKEEAGRWKKGE